MRIRHEQRGQYLLVFLQGRLDASWCELFEEQVFVLVRQGHHHLVLDSSELEYLSSAGIRSLAKLYKELLGVQGDFTLSRPTGFVKNTLEATGFGQWLSENWPDDMPSSDSDIEVSTLKENFQVFSLLSDSNKDGAPEGSMGLSLGQFKGWSPWGTNEKTIAEHLDLGHLRFALGIGCPYDPATGISASFGEFVAVDGNLAYQPPDATARPDYMVNEGNYTPVIQAIQAIFMDGNMTHLIRFSPENQACFGLSELAEKALDATGASSAGLVILGEIDGVVGAHLIHPPTNEKLPDFPELRDHLMFSGERMHAGKQALIVGLVSRQEKVRSENTLYPMGSAVESLFGHLHAVVFPYQTLQNGKVALREVVRRFFHASPPLTVMHLLSDNRSLSGLGESALIRGACWCAPVKIQEDLP